VRAARSRLPRHEGTITPEAPSRIGRQRLARQGPAAGRRGSEPDTRTAAVAATARHWHAQPGPLPCQPPHAASGQWPAQAKLSRNGRYCCCEFAAAALKNGAYRRCNTDNCTPRSRVGQHRDCARSCAAPGSSASKRRPRRLRGLTRSARAACRTRGSTERFVGHWPVRHWPVWHWPVWHWAANGDLLSSTKRALSECCLPPAGAVCVLPRAARCADKSRRRSIARMGPQPMQGPNVGSLRASTCGPRLCRAAADRHR
jgi:hypothetical protein